MKLKVKEINFETGNAKDIVLNITDAQELVNLIVFKALAKTTIGSLTDFDIFGLKKAVGGTVKSAQKVTTEAVKTTADILKKSAAEITEIIKKPLGQN